MIDYIMVPQHLKSNLVEARSYSNLATSSDHRLVVCKIKVAQYLMHKPKTKVNNKKYNIQNLVHNREIQKEYSNTVHNKINEIPDPSWNDITKILHESTKQCIGYISNNYNTTEYSKEIEKLSNTQKEIKMQINNSKNIEQITKLRKNEIRS